MLATYVRALNVRRAQYTTLRARLPYLLSLKINNPMYVHYTCCTNSASLPTNYTQRRTVFRVHSSTRLIPRGVRAHFTRPYAKYLKLLRVREPQRPYESPKDLLTKDPMDTPLNLCAKNPTNFAAHCTPRKL